MGRTHSEWFNSAWKAELLLISEMVEIAVTSTHVLYKIIHSGGVKVVGGSIYGTVCSSTCMSQLDGLCSETLFKMRSSSRYQIDKYFIEMAS